MPLPQKAWTGKEVLVCSATVETFSLAHKLCNKKQNAPSEPPNHESRH